MAGSVTPPTHVPVAGLLVPVQLVPRIIASMRGSYPDITADLDDEAAVRAVLKQWVMTTLAAYESAQAQAPVVEARESVEQEFRDKADAARQKALTDAATIQSAAPAVP